MSESPHALSAFQYFSVSAFYLLDGQLHAALDDAGRDGVARQPGGVVDVQLFHEMLAVFLHGLDAELERQNLIQRAPTGLCAIRLTEAGARLKLARPSAPCEMWKDA
jgi:hypothetical protein